MTKEQADRIAKGCKRFEYDESGLGKLSMYGYNCTTCNHNNDCKRLKEATEDKQENALAKLANDLELIESGSMPPAMKMRIRKAKHIVAELAKVKVVKIHSLKKKEIVEIDYPEREDANIAFLKCREIAEEGETK